MKKNILIIGPIPQKYGGNSFGGIATHIEGLAEELSNREYKITIWNYKIQKDKYYDNQNIHIKGNSYLSYLNIFFCLVKYFFQRKNYLDFKENILLCYKISRLRTIIKTTEFHAIHVHSLHETAPIAIRKISMENNIKIISTDHGFWQSKNFVFQQKKELYKLRNIASYVDEIIYISNYAYQKHLQNDFNQLNKLVKIPNPLTVGDQEVSHVKKSNKKVIFFNGLSETIKRKRFDLLLNAIQNNAFLKSKVKVIAIVNSIGLEFINNNIFDFEIDAYGAIPMSQVNELYAVSDLMVLPSNSESFGLVYIESLIRGIPIIGFDEVVTEFQKQMGCYIGEGFDADDDDPSNLSRKIIKVLNHKVDTKLIQSKSIEIFSWKNRVSEFEAIYNN